MFLIFQLHFAQESRQSQSKGCLIFMDTMTDDRSHNSENKSHVDNIFSQLWAWFLLGGIFLQLPYLIGPSGTYPVYKIYTIVALFIGLLVIIFLYALKLQEPSHPEVVTNLQYPPIRFQKHHFFIIVVNGIGVSVYSFLHIVTFFTNYTVLEDPACKEEISCGIFHLMTFVLICLQIFFFYHISGKKVPNTIIYKALFTFLMVINLLCFTTIATNELKNLQTGANYTYIAVRNATKAMLTHSFVISDDWIIYGEMKNSSEVFEAQPITFQKNGIFVAFALQYFFMAAYFMFNFSSQLDQQSAPDDKLPPTFTFQLLYHSVRRWRCCKKEGETHTLIERGRPNISELIPFVKIFQTLSGVVIGSILSFLILFSTIYIDCKIMVLGKNDSLELYYKLLVITRSINELIIIVSIFIAFIYCKHIYCLRSITRFLSVQHKSYEETKGDRIFIIFAQCGVIFENLLGFYALFLNSSTMEKSLLIIFGVDYTLGFINSAIQTHFILCGLELRVISKDETDNYDEQRKRHIAQSIRRAGIVCATLNLISSIVYLYETQRSYFNIVTQKAYGSGVTWKSIQLLISPLLIYYRLYSSVCIFKIIIELSNIPKVGTVHTIEDNNYSLRHNAMTSRNTERKSSSGIIWNIDQNQRNDLQINSQSVPHARRLPIENTKIKSMYNNISSNEFQESI